MRNLPEVAYLFFIGLDCLLGQSLYEYSIACPVGTEPGPVVVLQALAGFPGLKGFLILGSPHEVGISLVVVVVHKDSI